MKPDFLDIAMLAYLTIWRESNQFPPDSEAVKRLAYELYENTEPGEKIRQGNPMAGVGAS